MNEQKALKIFEKEISRREKSSRWSRIIAMNVLAHEAAPASAPEPSPVWKALYYGFSVSTAVMLLVGALFLNSALRTSFQKSDTIARNSALEDFFNPYSSNNMDNY